MMSNSSDFARGDDDASVGRVDGVVDPAARPVRRVFTAEYRAMVVSEYEAAPRGQKAAVLRREGLYQSQLRAWMIARDEVLHATSVPRRLHRASTAAGGKNDLGGLRVRVSNCLCKWAGLIGWPDNVRLTLRRHSHDEYIED